MDIQKAINYFDGYGSPYDEIVIQALEKQIPKPPVEKRHPKYPNLGIFHYCVCGALFPGWGNSRAETNYCGNCGQKIKGESEC